jgi:hypothetical protein
MYHKFKLYRVITKLSNAIWNTMNFSVDKIFNVIDFFYKLQITSELNLFYAITYILKAFNSKKKVPAIFFSQSRGCTILTTS